MNLANILLLVSELSRLAILAAERSDGAVTDAEVDAAIAACDLQGVVAERIRQRIRKDAGKV
jgi:hypothetical protein